MFRNFLTTYKSYMNYHEQAKMTLFDMSTSTFLSICRSICKRSQIPPSLQQIWKSPIFNCNYFKTSFSLPRSSSFFSFYACCFWDSCCVFKASTCSSFSLVFLPSTSSALTFLNESQELWVTKGGYPSFSYLHLLDGV